MKHTKKDCSAGDIIISNEGLQCGNCLAVEKKKVYDHPVPAVNRWRKCKDELLKAEINNDLANDNRPDDEE